MYLWMASHHRPAAVPVGPWCPRTHPAAVVWWELWSGGSCFHQRRSLLHTHMHTFSLSPLQKWHKARSVFSSKHKRLHFDLSDNLLISPHENLCGEIKDSLRQGRGISIHESSPLLSILPKHAWLTCAEKRKDEQKSVLPVSLISAERFQAHSSVFGFIFTLCVSVFGSVEHEELRAFNRSSLAVCVWPCPPQPCQKIYRKSSWVQKMIASRVLFPLFLPWNKSTCFSMKRGSQAGPGR